MADAMGAGSMRIATVMGIPIRVHFSWLVIFGLITWSLSTYYFPKVAPQLPGVSYWISGAMAAILLFFSVVLHELSHSIVAKRHGIQIVSITLFIFGGVAQIRGEPSEPKTEIKMALAGPLSSFAIAGLFYLSYYYFQDLSIKALFRYLYVLNIILGGFNLIPGLPMDGGRVVRAVIWKNTGDFFYATRKASNYGQKTAIIFIVFGIFSIFLGTPGGLWLMLIGWFLYTAAQSSYQQASFQELLRGVKVKDIMVKEIISITPELTIEDVISNYFLRFGYGGFPVIDNKRFLGFLTLKECKDVPKEKRASVRVGDIYIPHEKRWEVSENDEAISALELMISADTGRLAVVKDGALTGIITRNGIARYIQVAKEVQS